MKVFESGLGFVLVLGSVVVTSTDQLLLNKSLAILVLAHQVPGHIGKVLALALLLVGMATCNNLDFALVELPVREAALVHQHR